MKTFHIREFVFLSILLAAGCAGRQDAAPDTSPVLSTNAAVFDPSTSNVPLPNVLATAVAPDPLDPGKTGAVTRPVNTPMTPPEALSYINFHEVGNTNAVSGVNAPIYLQFTFPVQAATVNATNIKVFQITADPAGTENNPLGFADVTGLFSFQYSAGTTDLFLFPNFPLTPAARYLYVVTDRVLDAATAAPIIPSAFFQILQATTPPSGAAAALLPIWANATSGPNILFSGYKKVMDDLVAASATTTITDRTHIAVMGRFITSGAGFIQATASPASVIPVDAALREFAASPALPGVFAGWNNTATVTARITGPALEAFWDQITNQTPPAAIPVSPLIGSILQGTIHSGLLSMDPAVAQAAANAGTMNLSAVTGAFNDAAGVLQPFRVGGNLAGFHYTDEAIPFLYMVPAAAAPAGGYPLVIYQHGITSQKETVILLGQALAGAGFATLAIDLPEHGQLAPAGTTPTQWGQLFLALGAPLATRTNVQQAAFDLHRLELTVTSGGLAAGLAASSVPGLGPLAPATATPHYVGHSLGSIVGAYYLAGNTTLANAVPPYTQATLNGDMKGLLSVPGARLAYLIQASPAFSATINAGLAQAGINVGTPTYNSFFQATQTVIDTVDPATMTTPLAAGLPSRLSGRILIQEATTTGTTAVTLGDQVITNPFTRYFGNALGGEGVLGTPAAAAVGPGFFQLGYAPADRIPANFMFDLSGASIVPKAKLAAVPPFTPASPSEGYFQFDQSGINHSSLLADPVNGPFMQKQMVFFFGGLAVDPFAF